MHRIAVGLRTNNAAEGERLTAFTFLSRTIATSRERVGLRSGAFEMQAQLGLKQAADEGLDLAHGLILSGYAEGIRMSGKEIPISSARAA